MPVGISGEDSLHFLESLSVEGLHEQLLKRMEKTDVEMLYFELLESKTMHLYNDYDLLRAIQRGLKLNRQKKQEADVLLMVMVRQPYLNIVFSR